MGTIIGGLFGIVGLVIFAAFGALLFVACVLKLIKKIVKS